MRTPSGRSSTRRTDEIADVVHDAGLDAVAWLVEQKQLRSGDQGASDRQHFLLPAAQRAGALARPVPQKGEIAIDFVGLEFTRAIDELSHAQIVKDRHVREDFAPLRHVADSERGAAIGGLAALCPRRDKEMEPLRTDKRPMSARISVRLAHAVAAQHADDLARH